MIRLDRRLAVFAPALLLLAAGTARADLDNSTRYVQTNLVSGRDPSAGAAPTANHTDNNLLNPWGIAFFPGGPFWIADNHSGLSTLYDGTGVKQSLEVTIPAPAGVTPPSSPTGIVWNGSPNDFKLANNLPALFIFDSEDGTIAGWNGGIGTTAALVINNFNGGSVQTGAVYKGLALGTNPSGQFLFATNFRLGVVEAFNSANFTSGSGTPVFTFTDPDAPLGYAPFGIQNIGGELWVTFAKQDAQKHDDVAGPGNGFVDVFDTSGNLVERFTSGGPLNSPWGIARAPEGFGEVAGDMLIGNFGDGTINVYDPLGGFLGKLMRPSGTPITIRGLWTITFGGGRVSSPETLYFTAGPSNEHNGLFGRIDAEPRGGH